MRRQPEPHRVRQLAGREPVQQLVGRSGAVDPDEHGPAAAVPGDVVRGQLTQGGADDGDVVGGGVRPGVAGPQQHPDRLPGALAAVVDERGQRMMAEPALERRRRRLLVRMGGHQRGVDVDDHRTAVIGGVIRSGRPGPRPHHLAGRGPCRVDRRAAAVGVAGQRADQPRDRRVRRDAAEDLRGGAQDRDVGQAVPAQRERHRQVQQDLGRVVDRGRPPPSLERDRQRPVQPGRADGVDQQHRTGVRHHARPGSVGADAWIQPRRLPHQKGAPPARRSCPSARQIIAGQEHLSLFRLRGQSQPDERPGLTPLMPSGSPVVPTDDQQTWHARGRHVTTDSDASACALQPGLRGRAAAFEIALSVVTSG